MVIAAISRIPNEFSHLASARSMAEHVLESTTRTAEIGRARTALALLAAARSDDSLVKEQYAIMEPRRGTMVFWAISADRLLGLLTQTMDQLDQAVAHFEDALIFCRKAGYRPELAWSCHDYADTLFQRSDPGDREKAVSMLDESLAISTELGMRPLMERP